MRYYLYRWSVRYGDLNPYQAPELCTMCLIGFRNVEPLAIRTSSVVEVDGREITTYSGSIYLLQDIDTDYRDWLDENQIKYDPENPIKIKKV